MGICKERIQRDIETISSFNDTPGYGWTRISYSEADKKARAYLIDQFAGLGLSVRIDGVGNIRGRLNGVCIDAPTVMAGSHIDTVPHGGRFDGVVGVVGALETARSFVEERKKLTHPFEIIVFVEEEGSNFMSTLAGSKVLTGRYGIDDLKGLLDVNGISMYEKAYFFGLNPESIEKDIIRPGEVKAMIELHVEQGAVLDSDKVTLGVVEAISGIKTFVIEMKGVANHAGATPMYLRKDPLIPAVRVIDGINRIILQSTNSSNVGTVGRIDLHPNVPNIIPGQVTFTLDLRSVDFREIELMEANIRRLIECEIEHHDVEWSMNLIAQADPVSMDEQIVRLIEKAALDKGISFIRMNSGAVHDCSLMAGIASTGLIFVPSISGRSHVPEEETRYEDIVCGVEVLSETIEKLAE